LRGKMFDGGSSYKRSGKKYGRFSLKRVKNYEGMPINPGSILLCEDRASLPPAFAMRDPIELHLNDAPKLHSPILIAGLPDSGRVAKIVLDHLVKTLKASPLGYLHSDYLPPRVLLKPDGTPELMKHEFYYWVNSAEGGNDLVLYTGDAQPILPEGAFRLSEAVVDLAERLGVGTLITVGAFITGRISDSPKVYGAASETDLVKELKALDVQIIDSGAVTWMNGLIPGLAKVRNLKGLFLSGETSGFMVDPRAAMIILRVLIRKLGLQIEMKELEDQAKEIDDALKKGKDDGASAAEPGKAKYVG
jgi:uncharacterized protein